MSNTDAEHVCVVCTLKCAGLRLGIRVAVCGYVRGLDRRASVCLKKRLQMAVRGGFFAVKMRIAESFDSFRRFDWSRWILSRIGLMRRE